MVWWLKCWQLLFYFFKLNCLFFNKISQYVEIQLILCRWHWIQKLLAQIHTNFSPKYNIKIHHLHLYLNFANFPPLCCYEWMNQENIFLFSQSAPDFISASDWMNNKLKTDVEIVLAAFACFTQTTTCTEINHTRAHQYTHIHAHRVQCRCQQMMVWVCLLILKNVYKLYFHMESERKKEKEK